MITHFEISTYQYFPAISVFLAIPTKPKYYYNSYMQHSIYYGWL